jgi:predicted ATPase with chaperone activity
LYCSRYIYSTTGDAAILLNRTAKRLPTIIPPLTLEEALEIAKIHSVAGKIDDHAALMTKRPFRSPHHTITDDE